MSTTGNIWFNEKWFIMTVGPKQGKSLAHRCDTTLGGVHLVEWDIASQSWYCPQCDATPSEGIQSVCKAMSVLTVRNNPR